MTPRTLHPKQSTLKLDRLNPEQQTPKQCPAIIAAGTHDAAMDMVLSGEPPYKTAVTPYKTVVTPHRTVVTPNRCSFSGFAFRVYPEPG